MKTFSQFLLENLSVADALKVFDVTSVPSKTELQKLYKKLSIKFHPDMGGSNEKMSLLNQAKEVLSKATPGRSYGSNSSDSDDSESRYEKNVKAGAKFLDELLKKFKPEIYKSYIEETFGKKFEMKVDLVKSGKVSGHLGIELADSNRDVVFELNIRPYMMDLFDIGNKINARTLGAENKTIELAMSSDILVNGRKQALQKGYVATSNDTSIFTDPTILLPEAKIKKFANGKARTKKNSKLSKRDILAMLTMKYGVEDLGNNWFAIPYGKDSAVLMTRSVIERHGMWSLHSHGIKVESKWHDKGYYWKNGEPIRSAYVFETQEDVDLMMKLIEKLQDDKNVKAFVADFKTTMKFD